MKRNFRKVKVTTLNSKNYKKDSKTTWIVIAIIVLLAIFLIYWFGFKTGNVTQSCIDTCQASCEASCPPIVNGLVAYWKFDENSGSTTIDNATCMDGTIVGATRFTGANATNCKFGNCLSFSGGLNYVSINHDAKLKPASQITLNAWVNPSDISTNRYYEIYRKEDGGNRHLFSFQEYGAILSFGIATNSVYAELDVPINKSNYVNQWSMVTATYDGSMKKVYKDGVLIGSASATGQIGVAGTAKAYIGSSMGGGEFFKGLIDEVRVYNRALNATEIQQLYSVCTPNCAGKTCGDNGCGGSCGTCSGNQTCNVNGTCVAQTGTGNIYATSSPTSTTFYINGVYGGYTPTSVSKSVGSYLFNFQRYCYYDYNTTVTVYAGQTTNVFANMTRRQPYCDGTTPSSCSQIAYQANCTAQRNCAWIGANCTGSIIPCVILNQANCTGSCYWNTC